MFNPTSETEFDMLSRFDQATLYNEFAKLYNYPSIIILKDNTSIDGYMFTVQEVDSHERRFIDLLTVGRYIKNKLLSDKSGFFLTTINLGGTYE